MSQKQRIVAVIGPTASGKSAKAVELARERDGEVISVDSRQVYRTLDIGTEKTTAEEMRGIPHHLIDIREPEETYSAGEFVEDAIRLIDEITSRGKLPILAGGTHFYFDALLNGIPQSGPTNPELRAELEELPAEELFARLQALDPRRAERIDPKNPRRLVRALELAVQYGSVPERPQKEPLYNIEWIVIDPPKELLRERIDARLSSAFERGLIDEVRRVREHVGDTRLSEFGLEYRVVGEYLRGEREEASLLPALSSKLWHFARRQKAWIRKLLQDG
jgi:tRNA dimethylallyltransferase